MPSRKSGITAGAVSPRKQPINNKHTMKPELLFVGLDVHAQTIAVAEGGCRHEKSVASGRASQPRPASPDVSVNWCWFRPGPCTDRTTGGAARLGGDQPQAGPAGVRRAGASESIWKLKTSTQSREVEAFPIILQISNRTPAL